MLRSRRPSNGTAHTHARAFAVTITARLKRKKGARTDKTVTGYCNERFLSQSKLVSLSERPVLGDGRVT
jgi:hypothetical protein